MKKLSIIVDKPNICPLSGWNEKQGSEIRLDFYTMPKVVASGYSL